MGILDRIKLALLRRELAALQAADREGRNAVRTTHDMMVKVIENTTRIVELQNRIRAIEGVEDAHDDSDFGDARIPSSMFIPSKQDPP